MDATTISPTYFRDELSRFRDLCGNRDFWAGPQSARDAAFKGITVLYLSTSDLSEADITSYGIVTQNYMTRESYLARKCGLALT